MASDNSVTLVGNITDDPELRFTPSGQPVANFTVAVNRRFRGQDGNWEDKLEGFFRCTCWRDMAEHVAESLHKGARVVVVGRLQEQKWEDAEGNSRSRVEVQVDEVGPSLRWATASVTKSQRSGGSRAPRPSGPQEAGAPAAGGGDWSDSQGSQSSAGSWDPDSTPASVGTPPTEEGNL